MRYYEIVHVLGIHSWDIPALIALVILIVVVLWHHHNQKKRKKDFEEELEKKIQEIREPVQNSEEGTAGV